MYTHSTYINQKAKKLDAYLKATVEIFNDINACDPLREFFKTQSKIPSVITPEVRRSLFIHFPRTNNSNC
jgi:hypothetical protein